LQFKEQRKKILFFFFNIPFNPFNLEYETDSDDEDEVEMEKRAKFWFAGLKASTGPTAKEILKIRKDLYTKVQLAMDEFKTFTPPDTAITSNSLYSSLYCRILQLEFIV